MFVYDVLVFLLCLCWYFVLCCVCVGLCWFVFSYVDVSPLLQGAPANDEAKEKYWAEFVAEMDGKFKDFYGADFVKDTMEMDPEEAKAKYSHLFT